MSLARSHEPIATINITPLIDVMLVLLIMMILTIPIATHKVAIDLPRPGPADALTLPPHTLSIAQDGAFAWDGRPISDAELTPLLAEVVRGSDRPVLHLRTDPETRYERFDQTLATVKRAGIKGLGFVGDYRYASR